MKNKKFLKELIKLIMSFDLVLEYDYDLGWYFTVDCSYYRVPPHLATELGITRTDSSDTIKEAMIKYLK